jgi:protoporphyrin/coproporphyrin ferrochelatase
LKYLGEADYQHGSPSHVGVLVTNLGTPDAPTPKALRRYLKQFLWDPRVVEVPRPLWWLILNGVILNIRPRRSAAKYATVWTNEGSPLLVIAQRQAEGIRKRLAKLAPDPMPVAVGMRYGNPSIPDALNGTAPAGGAQAGRAAALPAVLRQHHRIDPGRGRRGTARLALDPGPAFHLGV